MKKNSTLMLLLGLAFVLTACTQADDGKDTQYSSQSDMVTSTTTEIKSNNAEKTSDSVNYSDNTDNSSSVKKTTETSSAENNLIKSEEQAINTLTAFLEEDDDIYYMLWRETDDFYVIKLVSKSAQEKGGSGTAGFYEVFKKDGNIKEKDY
ncbi:hypothetical protein ACWN8V_01075 [Vagococcus elongatus]|uniref:Lipoprotein n=1 Tax=Vagococcus elongatus TaxID=180344 RepID=A0A430B5W6_9ENTE|nr:hypothetical protein [Vagococcus elongatus]RSU15694.1 hypothetical protein CBF29_01060 [Vagococcus elongatus]